LFVGDHLRVEEAVHDALMRMRGVDRMEMAMFLIDPLVLHMLAATSRRCLTVSEMAPVVDLPPATCYKLVSQMERSGLIAFCGTGRNGGRGKAAMYTSVLKEMRLDMRNGVIHLAVTWKDGSTEEFHRELVPLTEGRRPPVPSTAVIHDLNGGVQAFSTD
jgi:DNA-binding Lrp family transcriptional regulator